MERSFFLKPEVRKSLYVLLVILLTGIGLLLYFGCSGRKDNKNKEIKPVIASPSPSPDKIEKKPIVFKGSTLLSRDGEKKDWFLEAEDVSYDREKDQAEAKVVRVKFYDPDNKEVLTLSAKGALVDMKVKSLKFRGEVEALSSKGEKLTAKNLRWDNEKKLLIGREYIKITRKNAVMTAANLEADPELKKVVLSGNVKVDYPNGEQFLKF